MANSHPSVDSPNHSPNAAGVTEADRKHLIETVRSFTEKEITPRVAEYDRAEKIPDDLLAEVAELGVFGGVVTEQNGGLGLDYRTYAAVIEELAKGCQAISTLASVPSGLVGAGLERFGTDAQRERWLVPLAQGRGFGSAGVTEPRSGSDVAGMDTTYERVSDGFILRGAKAWISNLDRCDFVLTFATADKSLRHKGVSAFIVPRDTPGMELIPYKDKLGFRPLATGDVILNEVKVSEDALLGEEGEGFRVAMTSVERGRLGVAARAVGLSQACLEDSISYAQERIAFGKPIAEKQIVQAKITDMTVGTHTARLLVNDVADAHQRGERARSLTAQAKMYASDIAGRSANDAVQIHGAYGVSPEYRVSRMYRDAKVLQIVEGSNDLLKSIIGEIELGLRSSGE